MPLDIRMPIGLMFGIIGALLVVYGLLSPAEIYRRSLGVNLNLWWGLVLVVFGGVMLALGRRGRVTPRPTPEAKAVEEREHRLGLER
jgi:hypothetical protein